MDKNMIELNGDVKSTPKLILPKSYTNNNLELITKYHPLLAIDFDEDFIREIDSKADKKVLASRYKQNILKSLDN